MSISVCAALNNLVYPWFQYPPKDSTKWPPIHIYFDYEVDYRHSGLTDSENPNSDKFEFFTNLKVDSSNQRQILSIYMTRESLEKKLAPT